MICPKCGKNISSTSRYCQFCGFNINLLKKTIIFIIISLILVISFCFVKNKIETLNNDILYVTGIAPERFKNALDYARNINPRTTMELNESLRKGGYGDLVPYFYFDEKHDIVINIDGVRYTPDSTSEKTDRTYKKVPPRPQQLTRKESLEWFGVK